MIRVEHLPRIKQLILELNNLAEIRKTLLDQLWIMENNSEAMRVELMRLLDDNKYDRVI